jgi:O-acetylserine/cysteine efflux transporter
MPLSHQLLAFVVAAIWGTNFVVMARGLETFPPLGFAALRFALAFVPAAFFIARPAVKLGPLAAYGLLIGVGQFGAMLIALKGWISPGLASLVVQTQVFFTIALVMAAEGERPRPMQWLAFALATAGLATMAVYSDASVTALGLVLMLFAAMCWASANVVGRRMGRVNALALVVWSSAFAVPPLVLLSVLMEGPHALLQGLQHADLSAWLAVVWQAVGNALFGYAVWAWLLARHPAATVTPWALAVPVFGMGASAFWLGESLPAWKLVAAGLVLMGLTINVAGTRSAVLPSKTT